MSSNIRDFDASLKHYGEVEIPGFAEAFQRAIALEGLASIVMMTPVDTGRARAAWMVTFETPAVVDPDLRDKGGGSTIAAGSAVIAGLQGYQITWITNNVAYIEELEHGHSQQAPKGMLEVTFRRLQTIRRAE